MLGFIFAILVVIANYVFFYDSGHIKFNENGLNKVSGVVIKTFSDKPSSLLILKINSINQASIPFYKTIKAQLSTSNAEFELGDVITADVKLRKFRSRQNKYSFDTEQYAFRQHIHFKGKVVSYFKTNEIERNLITNYRKYIWDIFKDKSLNWLFYGLSTGDKSKTSREIKDEVIKLGIGHILAISGLHVGIVFLLCIGMAKILAILLTIFFKLNLQRFNLNIVYCLLSLLCSFVYIYLCDLPVSALRAWLIVLLYSITYFINRNIGLLPSLTYSLTVILIFDPFALLDPGLYLSFIGFATVVSIIRITQDSKFLSNYLVRLFLVQLALLITLAPLTFYYFQGISIGGIFVNLFLIPLLSLCIFPYLILCLLTDSILPNTDFIYVDLILSVMLNFLIENFSNHSWLDIAKPSPSSVILCYLSLMLLLVKGIKFLSFIPVSLYIALLFDKKPIWQVDFLDVGHGTSVIVTSGKNMLLYDLGAKYFDHYSLFEQVALKEIKGRNLNLDITIISHQDKDHAGGINELYEFDHFNSLLTFHDKNPESFCKQQSIIMGNIYIKTIWPKFDMKSNNNNSCVVKLTGPGGSVLLTGDIEHKVEKLLLKQNNNDVLKANILLVPHHGSKSSSSPDFIQQVDPDIGVISRNYYSPWKLPHSEVSLRYKQYGVELIDTALVGQITIHFYEDYYEVMKQRENSVFWLAK